MADVLTPAQRTLNMSRIRGRDTTPERLVRNGLHRAGFRFRLHARDLPGRPDMVFPKYLAVILVHGCFWHGHHCPLFRLPATREDFWATKLARNRARDELAADQLRSDGWRVMTVWECSTKGPARLKLEQVLQLCAAFLYGDCEQAILEGAWSDRRSPG